MCNTQLLGWVSFASLAFSALWLPEHLGCSLLRKLLRVQSKAGSPGPVHQLMLHFSAIFTHSSCSEDTASPSACPAYMFALQF